MQWKIDKLQNGESFITAEKGNSMVPLIYSGQKHKLEPATWDTVSAGEIVYCKVRGRHFTHLVKSVNQDKGCLIGNNKGGINGWTKQIFGRVTEIYER